VEEEHHNMRLDQYIQLYMTSFSREQVKKRIAAGDIVIKDRPGKMRSSSKVLKGDIINLVIHRTTQEDEYWDGEKIQFEETPPILYQDDELYVIMKPPYMATHPTGRHLFNCATVYFESEKNEQVYSVHRLDRETSGVMMLARNAKVAASMTDQFERNRVKKCYFWLSKTPRSYDGPMEFVANQRLEQSKKSDGRLFIHYYDEDSNEGKHARTYFQVLHVGAEYSFGLAYPQTGRQHQIRVHALAHGLPLLGDKLYLGSYPMFQRFKDCIATEEDYRLMEVPRHFLHALALNLDYDGGRKTFIGELPTDFLEWMDGIIDVDQKELQQTIKEKINSFFDSLKLEDD
jgi:RluA family pseudouridine synthase